MIWSIFAFITSLLCKGWNGKDKTHHLHQEIFHKFVSPVCFPSLVRHNKRNPSSHCFLLRFQDLIDGSLFVHQISPPPPSNIHPPQQALQQHNLFYVTQNPPYTQFSKKRLDAFCEDIIPIVDNCFFFSLLCFFPPLLFGSNWGIFFVFFDQAVA